VKEMAEELLAIRILTDFNEEVKDNLESQPSWGKNQLKEMLDTVYTNYIRRITYGSQEKISVDVEEVIDKIKDATKSSDQ
jgi:hypothetical protein